MKPRCEFKAAADQILALADDGCPDTRRIIRNWLEDLRTSDCCRNDPTALMRHHLGWVFIERLAREAP